MLTASRHGTNGMLAFTERRKPWENMAKYAAPDQYFVMHDANIDGTIESVSTVGTHQFYVVYPPPWNDTYAE
jgi:hypothetical protein